MSTAKSNRASAKQKPICHLRIGFTDLLIDADKGLQVLKLLGESTECELQFEGRGYSYVVRDAPQLALEIINPDRVKAPVPGRKTLALGYEQD